MTSEAVTALIAKNPSLKAAKAKLEAMEPGAYVIHRSWGFGQIKSYDDAAQRLMIDFKDKKGHPMDPAFCHHDDGCAARRIICWFARKQKRSGSPN